MAVLLEGISVVFPTVLMRTKYTGGWEQFNQDIPEAVVINDGELLCTSFFPQEDVMQKVGDYLNLLEQRGLSVSDNSGHFIDVAIIDQLQNYPDGYDCEWLTIYAAVLNKPPKPEGFGTASEDEAPQEEGTPEETETDESTPPATDEATESDELTEEEIAELPRVKAARLVNGTAKGVTLPKNWDYEQSLTKAFGIEKPEEPFVPENQN